MTVQCGRTHHVRVLKRVWLCVLIFRKTHSAVVCRPALHRRVCDGALLVGSDCAAPAPVGPRSAGPAHVSCAARQGGVCSRVSHTLAPPSQPWRLLHTGVHVRVARVWLAPFAAAALVPSGAVDACLLRAGWVGYCSAISVSFEARPQLTLPSQVLCHSALM